MWVSFSPNIFPSQILFDIKISSGRGKSFFFARTQKKNLSPQYHDFYQHIVYIDYSFPCLLLQHMTMPVVLARL